MEIKKSGIQVHKQFNQYQLLCLVKNETLDIKLRFIYLNLLFLIPEEKDPSIKADAYIILVKFLRTIQIPQNNFSLFSIYKAYNYINEYISNIHCYDLDYINFYKNCAEFFDKIQMLHLSTESINKCKNIIETYETKVLNNNIQSEERKILENIKDELKSLEGSLNDKIKNKKEELNKKLLNE